MDRATLRRLHFALIGGLTAVMAVFGSLFLLGAAPFLRSEEAPLIAIVLAVVALGPMLLGLFWARGQIPLRLNDVSVEVYWCTPDSGGRALLLWVLWEGGAMIGTVGTLLTGSLLPASVAMLGLALLVTHGPGYLESRKPTR